MPVKTKILPEGRTKAFFMGSCTTVTVQSYAKQIAVRTRYIILWIRDNNSGSRSTLQSHSGSGSTPKPSMAAARLERVAKLFKDICTTGIFSKSI
jgi:hypothetical protein